MKDFFVNLLLLFWVLFIVGVAALFIGLFVWELRGMNP